jgi:isoleucyl-tRNA synthetase
MTTPTPVDYKDTLFLPETSFPMRGNLPEREPETLKKWQDMDLFAMMQDAAKDRPKFILHFGPPFANGNLHAGHALTKTLKDVVVRTRYALGYASPMVPGWDCHGLPIEWKIEEKYRAAGKNKDDVPVVQFRQECRDYAAEWAKVQAAEMARLGVTADWKNPYLTMNLSSEATIASEIHKFLMNGMLYRGVRPVLWSVVEKTALAAAEVEYHEHTSTTVYVAFPVKQAKNPLWADASVVIWTTTPWTLPGNRAVAVGEEMSYGLYEVVSVTDDAKEGSVARIGQKIFLSTDLKDAFCQHTKVTELKQLDSMNGADLAGMVCHHTFHALHENYQFDVPVLIGDFVTTDTGTGFVHIAPGHGEDDYRLGRAHNIAIPETVDGDGTYTIHAPLFTGLDVYNAQGKEGAANGAVIGKLVEAGTLMGKGKLRHQYPHSWRSKAPLIFRTTAQWFIEIDQSGLRDKAMNAIEETQWVPGESKQRIKAMVSDRPDWCISRQRVWGVPIAIFVDKKTNEPLRDDTVNARIAEIFTAEGSDAWYARPAQDFLGDTYKSDDFEQVMDIVDVWFESGSTHAFVLEKRPDQHWPADLYLEGSDQHRGWFQSSLLEACGTRGRAPFKAVMTHGFVVDKDGKKMSKSAGNGLYPQDILKQHGADILRLWVLTSDFHDDVRLSQDAFKAAGELYRRFRNTLRYILGNLDGFDAAERVDLKADYTKLPSLEQWVLHRVAEINDAVKNHVTHYQFHAAFKVVYDFCNSDLSAFYFDIRKDRLYCDRPDLYERRVTRSVLEVLLDSLTTWLAAFIPFTAEEVWHNRPAGVLANDAAQSVHLRLYQDMPQAWHNETVAQQWDTWRDLRRVITGAIEIERAEKRLGSSLEAHPLVFITDKALYESCQSQDWAELAITSQCTLKLGDAPAGAFTLDDVVGVAVVVEKAQGQKCQRSWKILPDVGQDAAYPDLSPRDAQAVRYYQEKAKAA